MGGGSPKTINPLLDTWWKRLAARLDAGPAALHRLPESVAHVAEALWMQALDEGRRRAQLELQSGARLADEQKQTLEVRSHVLTLREGELDSRLRERESTISDLNLRLRDLALTLRKEQATRDAHTRRIAALEDRLLERTKSPRPRIALKPTGKSRRSGTTLRKKGAPRRRKGKATARRRR
jgi:hypothetical protein